MKSGRTLVELAQEIERQRASKQDFVAPVTKMQMVVAEGQPALELEKLLAKPLTTQAHGQLADYVGIPKQYYDRMQANPELLARNVNAWLPNITKSPKNPVADRRLVRTLDGQVRALLSDGYRPLENDDLAEAVLPLLMERDMVIASCDITATRLYIKAYDRRIERDVPTGAKMGVGHVIFDTVSPAIIVSNSETGFGRLSVDHGIYTRQCTNLASYGPAFKRTHIGGRAEESDEVFAMLTDKTKQLNDAAIWAKVRDVVAGALDAAMFEAKLLQLGQAAEDKIRGADVGDVIEVLAKRVGITEGERSGILTQLIEGSNLSRYGLSAAITRAAQDVQSYDRASELERIGGQVIELGRAQWDSILEEAA